MPISWSKTMRQFDSKIVLDFGNYNLDTICQLLVYFLECKEGVVFSIVFTLAALDSKHRSQWCFEIAKIKKKECVCGQELPRKLTSHDSPVITVISLKPIKHFSIIHNIYMKNTTT